MYVSEICAEGIFVTFPWWLDNVKSRSKIALFSNERHFEIWFPKKRTITFFWSKLSKLHKKDQILHVATTFSLKQGETRTSHGPIPHPLMWTKWFRGCGWRSWCHFSNTKCADHVKRSLNKAIRTPTYTNYFSTISTYCACLSFSTRFRFLHFRMNNNIFKHIRCYIKKKTLQTTQGGH